MSTNTDTVQQHFIHKHPLTLVEIKKDQIAKPPTCKGCIAPIHDWGYTCTKPNCKIWLHKLCFKLPPEIHHPIHPHHPLALLALGEDDFFVCDGCSSVSGGFTFHCRLCSVRFDVSCVSSPDRQVSEGKTVKTTINHFSHVHELTFCNVEAHLDIDIKCDGCKQPIIGSAYACLMCALLLHENCLISLPHEVQSPFHPQHPLLLHRGSEDCSVCDDSFEFLGFRCAQPECNFSLHASCAKYKPRPLKHKYHEHGLYYFGVNDIGRRRRCIACNWYCDGAFLCCVQCSFDVHVECIPLPKIVRHRLNHHHPFNLMDALVEDDSGEYYCDICETKRNPEHHVYYCQKCTYLAHIDCIISEDETNLEVLEYLVPKSKIQEDDDGRLIVGGARMTEKEAQGTTMGNDSAAANLDDGAAICIDREQKETQKECREEEHPPEAELDEAIADVEGKIESQRAKFESLSAKLELLTTKLKAVEEKRAAFSTSRKLA